MVPLCSKNFLFQKRPRLISLEPKRRWRGIAVSRNGLRSRINWNRPSPLPGNDDSHLSLSLFLPPSLPFFLPPSLFLSFSLRLLCPNPARIFFLLMSQAPISFCNTKTVPIELHSLQCCNAACVEVLHPISLTECMRPAGPKLNPWATTFV